MFEVCLHLSPTTPCLMRATMPGAIQVPFEDARNQAEFTGFSRRPQGSKGRGLSAFETPHPKIEHLGSNSLTVHTNVDILMLRGHYIVCKRASRLYPPVHSISAGLLWGLSRSPPHWSALRERS